MISIRARPRADASCPPSIGHVQFKKALLAGDLGPGTYRVHNTYFPHGGRCDVITVPSRIPAWVRSPNGRLWHRVRYAKVYWSFAGRPRETPHLVIVTWCGMGASRGRAHARDPQLLDEPAGECCSWCQTSKPDRRRLPDRNAVAVTS